MSPLLLFLGLLAKMKCEINLLVRDNIVGKSMPVHQVMDKVLLDKGYRKIFGRQGENHFRVDV